METPMYYHIHPKFKLNGFFIDKDDLKSIAYDFIKEGLTYQAVIGDFIQEWLDEKDHVFVQTSGSTGTPKQIKIYKQQMVNSAVASGEFFGLVAGQKALLCLPVNYIAGKLMLVRAMVLGLDIDLVAPSSKPLQNNNTYYHFVAMIPLQVQNSLSELVNVRKLIVGGASMNTTLKAKVQHLKTQIFETYGMTETVTHIAAKRINGTKEFAFTTLPNVSISIDERSCLKIEAPKVSSEIIQTNDIVELVSNHQFIWKGRFDNVINSGGVKLFPEQIEAKLSEIITENFFVTGMPDAILGEKLVLIIQIDHRQKAIITKRIQDLSLLDKFEIPKEIICVEAFQHTENGKINRKATLSKL
ncbi:AMP-binding protein [Zhouia sp. PK063]|uniref:AMP-binding protein n=1 Tax=Zhouia sp. PK063 TaxID=3373602 RepID=UPI00378E6E18